MNAALKDPWKIGAITESKLDPVNEILRMMVGKGSLGWLISSMSKKIDFFWLHLSTLTVCERERKWQRELESESMRNRHSQSSKITMAPFPLPAPRRGSWLFALPLY